MDPRQIGYLPEDRGLYRDQKVGRILEYFVQLRGMSIASLEVPRVNGRIGSKSSNTLTQNSRPSARETNRRYKSLRPSCIARVSLFSMNHFLDSIQSIRNDAPCHSDLRRRNHGAAECPSVGVGGALADRVFLLSHGKRVIAGTVPELKSSLYWRLCRGKFTMHTLSHGMLSRLGLIIRTY